MVRKCLEAEVLEVLEVLEVPEVPEEKVALEKAALVALEKVVLEADRSGVIALIGGERMATRTILRKVVALEMTETMAVPIITPCIITPQFARARSMWSF